MFCPKCRCDYVAWWKQCPCCEVDLVAQLPPRQEEALPSLSYNDLVTLVRDGGGRLKTAVHACETGRASRRTFPYQGYGFAWVRRMEGALQAVPITLRTTAVGAERVWRFPYQGYGFGWAQRMRGHIGGHPARLTTTLVGRERNWTFPYLGYGYGWAREMRGFCGEELSVMFEATDVERQREWRFPYQGYGYAWVKQAVLTVSLADSPHALAAA